MEKLVDIKNGEQEKAFELHGDDKVLYLRVKCSSSKKGHRYVNIKVSDVLYQVGRAIAPDEWRQLLDQAVRNK